MNPIKWLQSMDAALVNRLNANATGAATAAQAGRSALVGERAGGYRGRDISSLAPEVAALIGKELEAETVQQQAAEQIRKALGYRANQSTMGLKPDEAKFMARLQSVMPAAEDEPGANYQKMARALAEASVATNPSMGIRAQDALAGLNQNLADSGWSRAGLYGTIATGGVAAVPLVTEAGRGLMELMGFLQEGHQTEAKRDQVLA